MWAARYGAQVRTSGRVLCGFVIIGTVTKSVAGGPGVLLATGSRLPEGYAVADIGAPVAGGGRRVIVDVSTHALLAIDTSARAPAAVVIAASGDPVPSVPGATMGTLDAPIIGPDGRAVFTATVDGAPFWSALFRRAGASVELLAMNGGSVTRGAATRRGDVVYRSGTRRLLLWREATRTLSAIAQRGDPSPLGHEISRLGRSPRINETGMVASLVDTRERVTELIRWADGVPAETILAEGMVAASGDQLSMRTTDDFALGEAGQVAIVTQATSPGGAYLGLFRREPDGRVDLLAATGQAVDGRIITDFDQISVFFDDDADVLVLAELDDAEDAWLRARDGELQVVPPALAPCTVVSESWSIGQRCGADERPLLDLLARSDADPPGAGFWRRTIRSEPGGRWIGVATERRAVVALDRAGARTLLRTGQPVGNLDVVIDGVITLAASAGRAIVALGASDERRAIVAIDGAAMRVLARSDDWETEEDPYFSLDPLDEPGTLAAGGARVVFLAADAAGRAIFEQRGDGMPLPLVRVGDPAPEGGTFSALNNVAASESLVVFGARVDDAGRGVFGRTRDRTFRIWFVEDDGVFVFPAPAVRGRRVLGGFYATPWYGIGIGLWTPRRGVALAWPDEANFTGLVGFAGRGAVAEVDSGVVFVPRRGRVRRVVGYEDPSPLGGTISLLEASRGLPVAGGRLVVDATLDGATSREALLAYSLRSPSGAFVDASGSL